MGRKTEVRFWLDQNELFVQNEATEEIKTIKDQKQIALFLNEHGLVANEVKSGMYGFDVMGLFENTKLSSLSSGKR